MWNSSRCMHSIASRKAQVAVLAGAVAVIGLMACDRIDLTPGDLSRARAGEMIVSHVGYPIEEVREFVFPGSGWEPNHPVLEALKSDGAITYNASPRQVGVRQEWDPDRGRYMRRYRTGYLYEVTDTESGHTHRLPPGGFLPHYVHRVRIAERRFEAVTGIHRENGHTHVEYTWRYANPTPFAKHAGGDLFARKLGYSGREIDTSELHQARATFALYDDGWRIVTR